MSCDDGAAAPLAADQKPASAAVASLDSIAACHLAQQDLQAVRHEYIFGLPRSLSNRLAGLLRDERDLPLALAFMNMLVLALPAAAALHVFKVQSHAVGLAYMLVNYALFLQASPTGLAAAAQGGVILGGCVAGSGWSCTRCASYHHNHLPIHHTGT